jgi:hypothetical protein
MLYGAPAVNSVVAGQSTELRLPRTGTVSASPWLFEGFQYTRLQNVRLKNLSFLAKSKIGIFACFSA